MTQKTSHEQRTAAEPRALGFHNVRLSRVDQVNDRVRLLRLELVNGPVKFLPGQWLDVFVPSIPKAGGFTITSPPSLASSANPCPHLELAIQESPSNPPAAWLWRPEKDILGQVLQVRVGGSFVYPPRGWSGKRVIFVAGGVGINPLISMLSFIAEKNLDLNVKIAYGTKVPENGLEGVVFLDRIKELYHHGRVKGVVKVFTTGNPAEGRKNPTDDHVDIYQRRLSIQDVEELIREDQPDDAVVYICGPPNMTDEFVTALTSKEKGLGLDHRQVLTEKWW